MDVQSQELDSWDKAIKKTINVETKELLQSPFGTQKIDAKYFWDYRLVKTENKNSKKNKSTDTLSANVFSRKQQLSTHQS